jgi:hypothetical protein
MKKNILMVIFLFFSTASFACPYCGCGNSNFQIGVLPTYKNAFFGVRYTYAHFQTDSGSQYSRDFFHTTELWGGYKVGKFQLMAFVPYINVHKISDDGVIDTTGWGDITLLANYQLYSKTVNGSETKKTISNTLWAGGGIKLATGASNVDVNDPAFTVGDFSQSPGTGSTDYLLNVNHNLTFGNGGVVTNLAYRFNQVNAQEFQYGNRFYANSNYFYSFNAGLFIIRPLVGLNLVLNSANTFQGDKVENSDGYVLNGVGGVNIQKGKVGLLFNASAPVSENLYQGLTQFKERVSVALTYSF